MEMLSNSVELIVGDEINIALEHGRYICKKNICQYNSASIDTCDYFLRIGFPTARISPTEVQTNIYPLKVWR